MFKLWPISWTKSGQCLNLHNTRLCLSSTLCNCCILSPAKQCQQCHSTCIYHPSGIGVCQGKAIPTSHMNGENYLGRTSINCIHTWCNSVLEHILLSIWLREECWKMFLHVPWPHWSLGSACAPNLFLHDRSIMVGPFHPEPAAGIALCLSIGIWGRALVSFVS